MGCIDTWQVLGVKHGQKRLDEWVRQRLRAGRMLLAGKTPAEAAHAVGVARQTACAWKKLLDEGGIAALRAMPPRGRPARLDAQQLQALGRMLLDKPTDHSFGTELWRLKRVGVGVIIGRLYGVKFAQTQIWRILGARAFRCNTAARSKLKSAQHRPSIIAACWARAGLW